KQHRSVCPCVSGPHAHIYARALVADETQPDAFQVSGDADTNLLLPDQEIDVDVELRVAPGGLVQRTGLIELTGLCRSARYCESECGQTGKELPLHCSPLRQMMT